MSDADRLRAAAERLREVVDGLTSDTDLWDECFFAANVYGDRSTYERVIMHPRVALALADWLDVKASMAGPRGLDPHVGPAALRVADVILGGGSDG